MCRKDARKRNGRAAAHSDRTAGLHHQLGLLARFRRFGIPKPRKDPNSLSHQPTKIRCAKKGSCSVSQVEARRAVVNDRKTEKTRTWVGRSFDPQPSMNHRKLRLLLQLDRNELRRYGAHLHLQPTRRFVSSVPSKPKMLMVPPLFSLHPSSPFPSHPELEIGSMTFWVA